MLLDCGFRNFEESLLEFVNVFRNFLIFIWSFQHVSEILKNELQGSNRFRYLSSGLDVTRFRLESQMTLCLQK